MEKGATYFRPHLRRLGDVELFEQERAVRATLETDGWQIVQALLEAGKDAIQAQLKYGRVREQGEYARAMGELVGLEHAQDAAEAVLQEAAGRQRQLEQAVMAGGADARD